MKPIPENHVVTRWLRSWRLLTLLLTSLTLLASCGYQLRGYTASSKLPTFIIRGDQPYGDMGNAIRRLIPESIVDNAEDKKATLYTLHLSPENVEKRRVSTAKSALFTEDLITLEVDVDVQHGGESVQAPIHLTASRLFQDDQSQPTGKGLELQLLKSELRENLARQLIHRLESIDWQALAKAQQAAANKSKAENKTLPAAQSGSEEPEDAAAP